MDEGGEAQLKIAGRAPYGPSEQHFFKGPGREGAEVQLVDSGQVPENLGIKKEMGSSCIWTVMRGRCGEVSRGLVKEDN